MRTTGAQRARCRQTAWARITTLTAERVLEDDMAGTDDADETRLAGRIPRPPRRDDRSADAPDAGDAALDGDEGEELDTVTKLMGFLRDSD